MKLWWCEKGYSGGMEREGWREGRRREKEGETTELVILPGMFALSLLASV